MVIIFNLVEEVVVGCGCGDFVYDYWVDIGSCVREEWVLIKVY